MKKLITVAWSTTVLMDIPENETVETLNHYRSQLGGKIVDLAFDNLSSGDGEITDVVEEATTMEELEEQNRRDEKRGLYGGLVDLAN